MDFMRLGTNDKGTISLFKRTKRAGFRCRLLVVIILGILLTDRAAGQQSDQTIDAETVKALLQRVQSLEAEVSALKAQAHDAGATTPAAAPETTAATHGEKPSVVDEPDSHSMAGMAETVAPRLRLRGYGDVGWNVNDRKGDTNSFALGQLNLFLTSQLTDKVSFLAETIIEADKGTNEFGIEPERLMLVYNASDWLNLSFGRYHTGIGYYNTAYHHSALMQTTLGRPFLFAFEDQGGILPVHNVGVSASGTISSKYGFHYIAEIGNGRSVRKDGSLVQNVTDENNGKAFNLAFFMRPSWLGGSQFGFSAYHDHLTSPGATKTKENIFSAHFVYQNTRFEFLNEAVLMRHSPDNSNLTVNIPGFYSQISRQWGNYRPYFRYEYVKVPSRDPLFADVGLLHGPRIGLRYDLNEFSAFKLEYNRSMRQGLNAVNFLGTQLSFAF